MEVQMGDNGKTETAVGKRTTEDGNGKPSLTPQDVERLFGDGYHEIEILPDGTLRETTRAGNPREEQVTRSLKTERTWY
jgi:hypothetical protein